MNGGGSRLGSIGRKNGRLCGVSVCRWAKPERMTR
jgi:hypothetical protein